MKAIPGPTRYVSASRLEPKRTGGYRHIVDLRTINNFLVVPRCKYESLGSLPFISRRNDFGVTFDM